MHQLLTMVRSMSQLTEVLCSPWHDIIVELEDNPPDGFRAGALAVDDVKVYNRAWRLGDSRASAFFGHG